ncbi:MAG TPA: hypothetical protein VGL92_02295 [Acidimicrobiia bacterium]
MKRTGRTLVILTLAAWLAALTPAGANTGPSGAPAPAPGPAGDDPVRIGVGVGGELIDFLSHHHDDDGDDDGDHHGDGLLGLLLGHGDDNGDDDDDGLLEELVHVVDRVLAVVFGEDEDSVSSPALSMSSGLVHLPVEERAVPVAAVSPADDDGFEELLEFLQDVLDDLLDDNDVIEAVEDVVDTVTDAVEAVVCAVVKRLEPAPGAMPCVP